MCGRYVISSKYERIRTAFEHPILKGPEFDSNLFVLPGEYVPVISSADPNLQITNDVLKFKRSHFHWSYEMPLLYYCDK